MATPAEKTQRPEEGVDYYLEDGYFVFTESYLQKRGYCCQSGCRHCPYGFHTETVQADPSRDRDRP